MTADDFNSRENQNWIYCYDSNSHNISTGHFVMFYFAFIMACLFYFTSTKEDLKRLTRVKRGYGQGFVHERRYGHHRCGHHQYHSQFDNHSKYFHVQIMLSSSKLPSRLE